MLFSNMLNKSKGFQEGLRRLSGVNWGPVGSNGVKRDQRGMWLGNRMGERLGKRLIERFGERLYSILGEQWVA